MFTGSVCADSTKLSRVEQTEWCYASRTYFKDHADDLKKVAYVV